MTDQAEIVLLSPIFSEDVFNALLLEAAGLPPAWVETAGLPPQSGQAAHRPPAGLAAVRERFARGLHALRARTGQGEYIAVWLEAWVEEEVDAAFAASPERGFWLHALSLALCLAAMRGAAPAAFGRACLPLPLPGDAELADVLNLYGLACTGTACAEARGQAPRLERRYALLAPAAGGGCAVCALAAGCPRLCSISV